MQLNLQTDYALRVLVYLAAHPNDVVTQGTIADAYQISANHLAKVVTRLAQLEYINAARGKGGGLTLAKQPNEIVVGTVVRQMENTLAVVECHTAENTCPIAPVCSLAGVLASARDAFLRTLDQKTLDDVLPKTEQKKEQLVQLLSSRKTLEKNLEKTLEKTG